MNTDPLCGEAMIDELEIQGQPPALDLVEIDALICEQYWYRGELNVPANVVHIRVGPTWHRLCFDCGIIFWRTSSGAPVPYAMPELDAEVRLDDIGSRLGVAGEVIETYEASAIEGGSQVAFLFAGDRQIVFKNIDDLTTIAA